MGLPETSPFAPLAADRIVFENEHVVAFRDGFPVSPGHTLVVAKQVSASLFQLAPELQSSVWEAVAEVREQLRCEFSPDGFNIGLNDGTSAGQTIAHAHVHIIPRYTGDRPDPRGGVRWIFPDKAKYWE